MRETILTFNTDNQHFRIDRYLSDDIQTYTLRIIPIKSSARYYILDFTSLENLNDFINGIAKIPRAMLLK